MPNVRISELSASVSVEDTNVLPIVSGGVTYKATPSQILQGTGIPSFSASLKAFTASIQTHTASTLVSSASFASNNNILFSASGSFRTQIATLSGTYQAFTASIQAQTASVQSFTSSVQSHTASVNIFSGTILNASSSFASTQNSLVSASGTFEDRTVSLNTFSASIQSFTASIQAHTASVLSHTASVQAHTASTLVSSASFASNDNILFSASGTFETRTVSLNSFSASVQLTTASLFVHTASTLVSSASFATVSSSYASNRARIEGTVVLSVSGSNVGDIRLTGSLYSSGAVYRRGNVRTISTNGPILNTDQILFISASANLVLTATNPAFINEPIIIKKVNPNAFIIQVAQFSGERIEGTAATYTLTGSDNTDRPAWTFMSDGIDFWIG